MNRLYKPLLALAFLWCLSITVWALWTNKLDSNLPPIAPREDLLPHFQHPIHVLEERVRTVEDRLDQLTRKE